MVTGTNTYSGSTTVSAIYAPGAYLSNGCAILHTGGLACTRAVLPAHGSWLHTGGLGGTTFGSLAFARRVG